MNPHEIDLHKELKKYFGFNQFKGLQEQVVKSIITGNNTFVIMPTGGGKSVCYQIPAIMADGLTVVISPLISLMQDQETNLNKIGVAAKSLTSFNTPEEQEMIKELAKNNELKVLMVAPERASSIITFLKKNKVKNDSFRKNQKQRHLADYHHRLGSICVHCRGGFPFLQWHQRSEQPADR